MSASNQLETPVIIGTAGHIDHGKSALVRALTGTDPDRLKEEKQRGITIELGFAFLSENIAFIDVPGHEKFIRHMAAGAATVDYAILVIAADDGIMPQTREHLDILTLLGVKGGLVVLTKADLVEEDWLELVSEEVAALIETSALSGAPILSCDSLSGRGIGALREAVEKLAEEKRIRGSQEAFRMPIDRVFTIHGHGTVVTGSILSGAVGKGDMLELMPKAKPVRVKGVQTHGQSVARAASGHRAALNIAELAVSDISRGDVVASAGLLSPSILLDAELDILRSAPAPVKHRQRIRLHIGTAEVFARVKLLESDLLGPGERGLVQFRLESPVAVRRMDRFIIRRYSPQATIGGGRILDPAPHSHRRRRLDVLDSLSRLASPDQMAPISAALEQQPFATVKTLAKALAISDDDIMAALEGFIAEDRAVQVVDTDPPAYVSADFYSSFIDYCHEAMSVFHAKEPLRLGLKQGELMPAIKPLKLTKDQARRLIEHAVYTEDLYRPAGDLLALPGFDVIPTSEQAKAIAEIKHALSAGSLTPPSPEELAKSAGTNKNEGDRLIAYLVDMGEAVRVGGAFVFSAEAIQQAREKLRELLADGKNASVSDIRAAWNTSRKFAVPLLEMFDAQNVTERQDTERVAGPALFVEREDA